MRFIQSKRESLDPKNMVHDQGSAKIKRSSGYLCLFQQPEHFEKGFNTIIVGQFIKLREIFVE
jgi:hypothetical protein